MERIGTRMSALMRYRDMIDDNEKEVFDMLMTYAGEVANSVQRQRSIRIAHC